MYIWAVPAQINYPHFHPTYMELATQALTCPKEGLKMKKGFLVAAVLFLLLFSFISSCSKGTNLLNTTQGVSDSEILIGSSSALGGHASFLGTQTIHGSLAYINEMNEKGGVHGRKIRLISYDDQYDPPKTVSNTQKLISQDKVFILFDYVGTPTAVKIIDIVHEAEIPILGFFTGAEALRTPFRPVMFHVRDSYYSEAEGAVAYFVDKLGLKKIAVMYQEDAFGLAVLTGVQLALKRRNMETATTATFVRGTMDVENAVKPIKASGAQAVIMVGTYSPLAKFIKKSLDADFTPYFHTVSFVGSEAFGKEIVTQKVNPAHYDKIVVTQVVPSPFNEELAAVKEYLNLIKKYYPNDTSNYVALEGFINAKVLVRALQDAGRNLTREKFIAALESMHGVDMGIGKRITYGNLDHAGLEGIYYSKVAKDGTFRIFQP
jgi:branched-chain amino acid transport system substrate-binding protein